MQISGNAARPLGLRKTNGNCFLINRGERVGAIDDSCETVGDDIKSEKNFDSFV